MLNLRTATRSHIGTREHNEDDLRTGRRDGVAWAVLSDGAGGHSQGAVASDLVVRAMAAALQSADRPQPQALHDAVHDTQALLLQQQPGTGAHERMHATLVALWIDLDRGHALWSHVGDSRLVLLRGGHVRHMTRDDSVVQQLIDSGWLTPEAARSHPNKNQLVCAMGVESDFAAHTLEKPYPLEAGDAFLLSTDGWWDHTDPARIERTLAEARDPRDWLDRMEAMIRDAALTDQDNHSAIALWIEVDGARNPIA